MNDSVLMSAANWAGAMLAAVGWAVSNWLVIVVAVALVAVAFVVVRAARASGRAGSHERLGWRGVMRTSNR